MDFLRTAVATLTPSIAIRGLVEGFIASGTSGNFITNGARLRQDGAVQ